MERMNSKTRNLLEWFLMLGGWFFFEWLYVDMIKIPYSQSWETYFPIVWCLMTVVAVVLGQSWKKPGNWILYAGFLLIFVRSLFAPAEAQSVCYQVITNAIWAMGVCYHLGSALRKDNLMRFLKVLIAGWTIQQTVAAVAGIICTLFDWQIKNLAGENLIWFNGRLHLLIYCTNAASNLVVSVFVAMLGVAITRNKLGRVLYIISMVIMVGVIPLTGTRTAFVTLGVGFGVYFGGWLLHRIKIKTESKHTFRRILMRSGAAICALVIVAVICTVMIQGGLLFNSGKAAITEEGGVKVLYRDLALTSQLLSGREKIWQAGFKMLADNPNYLLYGTSFGWHVIAQANTYTDNAEYYDHFHSLYLQTLVECGIPGFILLLGFILYFAKSAYTLYANKHWCAWQCTLPLIPITALVADLVESLTLLIYNYPVLPFMMLFMGVTIRMAAEQRNIGATE